MDNASSLHRRSSVYVASNRSNMTMPLTTNSVCKSSGQQRRALSKPSVLIGFTDAIQREVDCDEGPIYDCDKFRCHQPGGYRRCIPGRFECYRSIAQ